MFKPFLYCLAFVFVLHTSFAQNVLAPVYPDTSRPLRHTMLTLALENPDYRFNDIDFDIITSDDRLVGAGATFERYFKDMQNASSDNISDAQKEYALHIFYYRKYFKTSPVAFKECTFYNPAFNGADWLMHSLQTMPEALRFYSVPDVDMVLSNTYSMLLKPQISLTRFLRPFYFKKTAVTNKEYREFVRYVRDSIIRMLLYNAGDNTMASPYDKEGNDVDPPIINWKSKINYADQDVQENLADMYLPLDNRFYTQKEWDARKLNYVYYQTDSNGKKKKVLINIYPDTLSWIHDFMYPVNEPMTNRYFWHPVYDDYPVVGITKKQAEAYLNWKTKQEQKKLNKEGKGNWVVKYELPTEYQWEMVETAGKKEGEPVVYSYNLSTTSDYGYISDLSLAETDDTIKVEFNNRNDYQYISADSVRYNWVRMHVNNAWVPHSMFLSYDLRQDYWNDLYDKKDKRPGDKDTYPTVEADFTKNDKFIKTNPLLSLNYDCNGISYMGDNVSEWMQETYADYKPVYEYRHKLLKKLGGADCENLIATEDLYNDRNDTAMRDSASLVRGSNWYDDRIGGISGKNIEGMNAKAFVNPNSDYCTLGFRYVIILYRKDEKQIIDSMKKDLKSLK